MNNIIADDFNHDIVALGGGCFWCTEAVFKMLKGIIFAEPGYAGGQKENPIYEEVLAGTTGHAEVVKITYDPKIISFEDVLTVFFATHNPTTKNRQGNDVGEQYRSIILYTNEEQKKTAKKFIRELNLAGKRRGKPVVTEIRELATFYEAEHHHKDFYKNHPEENYCQVVIDPKLKKVKRNFAKLLKENI